MTQGAPRTTNSRTLWVEPDASTARPPSSRRGPFLPVLLVALALMTWLATQAVLLVSERQQLELAKAGLASQEQAAAKVRASLDQVATATAKLAAEGNPNARAIIEQLRSRGITINPSAASAPR